MHSSSDDAKKQKEQLNAEVDAIQKVHRGHGTLPLAQPQPSPFPYPYPKPYPYP